MDSKSAPSSSSVPPFQLINWGLAAGTAAKLAPAGPRMKTREINDAVADLRRLAEESVDHVYNITGLAAARDLRDSQLLIVDRASWSKANAQSFEALLTPTLRRLAEKKADELSPASTMLGSTVTGTQFGAILAFLSSKVLGQYDPFAGFANPSVPTAGRLLLVLPNIITVERELAVDPTDFRLWVCLHEQTHRVQFAAAPWLRGHMRDQISLLSGGLMDKADTLAERIGAAARTLAGGDRESITGAPGKAASPAAGQTAGSGASTGGGLLSLLQDPEDKAIMSHLTAVMSLLEGHANVVMDAVDASIVPTVKTIRQRFNKRSEAHGAVEKWLRKVLGLDAKMRQYSDGARFVRAVVDKAGMDKFNTVWASAEHLPTEEEIHAPELWLGRMGL